MAGENHLATVDGNIWLKNLNQNRHAVKYVKRLNWHSASCDGPGASP